MQKRLLDRLVIDSNVIISAALKGRFEEIAALKVIYSIEIYTCSKQISELQRSFVKLAHNLSASPAHYLKLFEELANLVEIDERFDHSPDAKDNYLFDLAYKVKSYYLVTGEKALLNMKQVNQIKVISIAELKSLLKKAL
jgi:putative PIN family toxin of toxin-antitoxin system